MIIMGIDPSLSSTGYAVVDGLGTKVKLITSGYIKTSPRDMEIDERMNKIAEELVAVLVRTCADYVIIERPAFGMNNGVRSVQDLAGLYYVILCKLSRMGYLVIPVMPAGWKSKVGVKGKDRKEQKQNAINLVARLFGKKVETNDESDAICIALYGSLLEVEKDGEKT